MEALKYIGDNYNELRLSLSAYCMSQHWVWSDDLYHQTILKIGEKERREPLKDATPQGIKDYLFISFKINYKRDKLYAYNLKRDACEDILLVYSAYVRKNDIDATERQKLLHDLYVDYAVMYLLEKLQGKFPKEQIKLFCDKHLGRQDV